MRSRGWTLVIGLILVVAGAWLFNSVPPFIDADTLSDTQQLAYIMGAFMFISGVLSIISVPFMKPRKKENQTNSTTPQNSSGSLESKLHELDGMKSRGVIDEAEYQRLRKNLIERS